MSTVVLHATTTTMQTSTEPRRRRTSTGKTAKPTPEKATAPPATPGADPTLSGPWFYFRQYIGFVLCLVAIAGTVLVSLSELEGTHSVIGIMAFLCLAGVALLLHEMRPYIGPGWQEVADYQRQHSEAAAGKQE